MAEREPKGARATVAALLRQARQRASLTQSELAALTGVAQPNISDYEGNRRSPTVRTMLTLLEGCGAELTLRPDPVCALTGPEVERELPAGVESSDLPAESDPHGE